MSVSNKVGRSGELLTAGILPDEFSRGYRGRLRTLNPRYPSVLKFMADLRKSVHSQESQKDQPPDAVTLALVAGIPIEQFIQNHSLLPFRRMVAIKDFDIVHGDPAKPNIIFLFGTRAWRQSMALFCQDCIKEDVDSRSFAYWHRSHQLPGIPWCAKHRCQLANSPIGNKAFNEMPSLEMDAHFEFLEEEFIEVFSNPIIQRYADIAYAILGSTRPTPLIHARFRIAELAKKFRIRVGARGQLPTLTDKLIEHVPMCWLKSLYPEITQWKAGKFFNSIDNITLGLAAGQSYILALALFFDSADEAINYWYGDLVGLPTKRKW